MQQSLPKSFFKLALKRWLSVLFPKKVFFFYFLHFFFFFLIHEGKRRENLFKRQRRWFWPVNSLQSTHLLVEWHYTGLANHSSQRPNLSANYMHQKYVFFQIFHYLILITFWLNLYLGPGQVVKLSTSGRRLALLRAAGHRGQCVFGSEY